MKWAKRILITVGVLVVLLVGGGLALLWMSGARPTWYRSKKVDPQAQLAAANEAENKIVRMQNWLVDSRQWPSAAVRPKVDTDPTTAPTKTYTISLTEDEMNAVLSRYEGFLLERYGKYISGPFLGLQDGHIIIAVMLKDTGRVLSVHIQPTLDQDGMFTLSVDTLMAGRIPIPRLLWSSYLQKLGDELKPRLEEVRHRARIDAYGAANNDAVASAMTRLLLQSIDGKPADPVLFLPNEVDHLEHGYPVRLVDVKIADETLKLTVTSLTTEEQQHLVTRLRAPFGEEPAPTMGK